MVGPVLGPGILPLRTLPSHRREKLSFSACEVFSSSPDKGKDLWSCPKEQIRRDQGPLARFALPGQWQLQEPAPAQSFTIFTSWALPVVASGSKCHRTLIGDFRVGLVRDVLPPGSVMGWHHVIMNLLKR